MRIGAVAVLISMAITLVVPRAAEALVYDIDLTADMAAFTAAGGFALSPCDACGESGFVSPFFSFPLGGTVNFGQVTIFPISIPGFANEESTQETSILYSTSNIWVAFEGPVEDGTIPQMNTNEVFCPVPLVQSCVGIPVTYQLTYQVPTGDMIRLSWYGSYSYVAPVPELSTWPMLLIGFAGIGLTTYRRRKSAMLAA